MKIDKLNGLVFLGYLLLFGLLFLQFPLHGALPGTTDSLLFLSVFKYIGLQFTGAEGSFLYPATQPLAYGESALIPAIIFNLFYFILRSPIWAWWLLLSFSFAATAFGMYLVSRQLGNNRVASGLAGLFFTAANFTLANIDSFNVGFWALGFFGIFYLLRCYNKPTWKKALVAPLLLALQIYVSVYGFLFVIIITAFLTIYHWRKFKSKNLWRKAIPALVILLVVISPHWRMHSLSLDESTVYNPMANKIKIEYSSLEFNDLFRFLPKNLLYKSKDITVQQLIDDYPQINVVKGLSANSGRYDALLLSRRYSSLTDELFVISHRRMAGIGVLIYFLALIGLFKLRNYRWLWLTLFLFGLILSLGYTVTIFGQLFYLPLYWFSNVDLFAALRIPSRAFYLCLFALCVLAAHGLTYLLQKRDSGFFQLTVIVMVIVVFLAENIPTSFALFPYKTELAKDIDISLPNDAVVLHLPSHIDLSGVHYNETINEYNRESLYVWWSLKKGWTTVNGVQGYLPISRLEIEEWVKQISVTGTLQQLNEIGISHIIFHKNLAIGSENALLDKLNFNKDNLQLLNNTDDYSYWKLIE